MFVDQGRLGVLPALLTLHNNNEQTANRTNLMQRIENTNEDGIDGRVARLSKIRHALMYGNTNPYGAIAESLL